MRTTCSRIGILAVFVAVCAQAPIAWANPIAGPQTIGAAERLGCTDECEGGSEEGSADGE